MLGQCLCALALAEQWFGSRLPAPMLTAKADRTLMIGKLIMRVHNLTCAYVGASSAIPVVRRQNVFVRDEHEIVKVQNTPVRLNELCLNSAISRVLKRCMARTV